MSFYLRKQGGEVYGPVELPLLIRWAADGRVLPEDQVSPDQETWSPAHGIPELGMDWLVDLGETPYGPLHLLALSELVRDGSVSPDHVLQHKATGERKRLGDALAEALVQENAQLRQAVEQAHARGSAGNGDRDRAELESARRDLETARAVAEQFRLEAQQWKERCQDAQTQAEARDREVAAQLSEAASKELAAKSAREALERKLAELTNKASAPGDESGSLTTAYRDLSQNFDRLAEQLSARTSELKAAQEARSLAQQEADDRIRLAEDRVRRLQAEADDSRRKLAELVDSHAQLVRAFRDLNDRFIRSRQTPPAPPPAAPPRNARKA